MLDMVKDVVDEKRKWIFDNFCCPTCKQSKALQVGSLKCDSCNANFSIEKNAVNFISPQMRSQFQIEETENVSAHRYDPIAMNIIERGGMVLDLSLIHI